MARVQAQAGLVLTAVQIKKIKKKSPRESTHRRRLLLVTSLMLYAMNARISLAKRFVLGLLSSTAPRYSVPRVQNIWKSQSMLMTYTHGNDKWFRQFFRCGRVAFDRLVLLLKPDRVFKSTGRKPQRPVWIQVATFLRHFGAYGGRHHIDTARDCGIAEGSVFKYIERVVVAVTRLRSRYVRWPEGPAAERVKNAFAARGFPNCLGAIDGSLIKLAFMPGLDPLTYYCRKKFYAINVSAVVDAFGAFIFIDLGWPGNQNDISILKRSQLWLRMKHFFPNGEYLLADRGYVTHRHFVRPYSDQEIAAASPSDRARMKKWNQHHSRIRIKIEHVFGLLKGRFPALKDMPGRGMKEIYRTVQALMILHNIFLRLEDNAEDIDDYVQEELGRDDRERAGAAQARSTPDGDKETGLFLRNELFKYM